MEHVYDLATQSKSRKLKILGSMLRVRMKFDYDRLCEGFTNNVVYRIVGDRISCPFAGVCVGKLAVREAMRLIDVQFEYLDLGDPIYLVDGDNVAARWLSRWRNRGSGDSAEVEGFSHIVFEGELVKEYPTFLDTAGLAKLADWP